MTHRTQPPTLPGCDVLTPMEPANGSGRRQAAHTDQGTGDEPKGRAARRKTGGRFVTLNAFVDFTLAGLNRNEIAVWLVLYRDTKDGIAQTSQADIARRAGASERTVRRAIKRLETTGLLTVVWRGGLRKGPSKYRVRSLKTESRRRTEF